MLQAKVPPSEVELLDLCGDEPNLFASTIFLDRAEDIAIAELSWQRQHHT